MKILFYDTKKYDKESFDKVLPKYEDIEIEYTGLRPGEKLYEELLMDEEGLQDTENKMIHIGKPIDMDEEKFMHQLIKLRDAANDDSDAIRAMVKEIVPTYQMPKEKEN